MVSFNPTLPNPVLPQECCPVVSPMHSRQRTARRSGRIKASEFSLIHDLQVGPIKLRAFRERQSNRANRSLNLCCTLGVRKITVVWLVFEPNQGDRMLVFRSAVTWVKRLCLGPMFLLLSVPLAGCVSVEQPPMQAGRNFPDPEYVRVYGPRPDERFPLPATDISEVDPQFLRQEVAYNGREQPGTIVVDTDNRYLYLVRENGRALRYGIGVGKEGLAWSGRARIGRKAIWPSWTPTADMVRREPERNARWEGGMPGGLQNPLGARALYLYEGDRDTLYRLHGTTEPWSVGQAVSSGCIRLFNQDIIDLFNRVPVGTPVVVLDEGLSSPTATVAENPRRESPVVGAW